MNKHKENCESLKMCEGMGKCKDINCFHDISDCTCKDKEKEFYEGDGMVRPFECADPNHSAGLHDVACPDYRKPEPIDTEELRKAAHEAGKILWEKEGKTCPCEKCQEAPKECPFVSCKNGKHVFGCTMIQKEAPKIEEMAENIFACFSCKRFSIATKPTKYTNCPCGQKLDSIETLLSLSKQQAVEEERKIRDAKLTREILKLRSSGTTVPTPCPDGRPGCLVYHCETRLTEEDKRQNALLDKVLTLLSNLGERE